MKLDPGISDPLARWLAKRVLNALGPIPRENIEILYAPDPLIGKHRLALSCTQAERVDALHHRTALAVKRQPSADLLSWLRTEPNFPTRERPVGACAMYACR